MTNLYVPGCVADLNHDGNLNYSDTSFFIRLFLARDLNADLNRDSEFDFYDLAYFLEAFSTGCP